MLGLRAAKTPKLITEGVMALQGHPRSSILAPIESEHATSYWSSIVTFVLSCPVSRDIASILLKTAHPYYSEF